MREIKFCGKRVDNGEWIYGDLVHTSYLVYIKDMQDKYTNTRGIDGNKVDVRCVEVIPETVGEYTGQKDKNDAEIYEGYIVKYFEESVGEIIYKVEWTEFLGCFSGADNDGNIPLLGGFNRYCEVIGNIHDNPELQEVE